VAALLQATLQAFGRLDCAFNNAGTLGDPGLTADLEEAQFDHMLAVNLKSVWIAMKYEIQHMLRQEPPGGAIVNTTSVNGLGGAPGASLYAAAKAGVLGLTKSAAMEYADQGIRVNALAAGSFRTPMLEAAMDHYAGGDPQALEEVQEAYRQQIPLGRIGRPEEAAQAAMWLCSEAASYVTGHTLIVDGGMSAAMR
jgi:NAD(P)-dependent dehydrogenase (short-subunit alcohol dehydrogenase family)